VTGKGTLIAIPRTGLIPSKTTERSGFEAAR